MKYFATAVCSAAVLLSGCAVNQQQSVVQEPVIQANHQEYLVGATLFTQHSGEFMALCYQAYEMAGEKLRSKLDSQVVKPAVILDLDETVLDNSPYTAWQIKTNNAYSDETWELWTDQANAEPIPGAVEFLQLADSLGVTLFYVSNRLRVNALHSTIENMRNLNIPQADEKHLYLKTTTSDKTARRDSILAEGYTILLYIGDNLGDFSAYWDKKSNADRNEEVVKQEAKFGNDYIILPNAIYGTWEAASYNFDRSLTEQQADSARKAALKPADLKFK